MLCHPGYESRHVGYITHHLVNDVIEVAMVTGVQRGFEGHLVGFQDQLHLEEWRDAERRVSVLHQVQ